MNSECHFLDVGVSQFGKRIPAVNTLLDRIHAGLVEVRYDGCHGVGTVTSIKFSGDEGLALRIDLTDRLRAQIVMFFLGLVDSRVPGCKAKAGGFGRFRWDRLAGSLHHTHIARRIEHRIHHFDGL